MYAVHIVLNKLQSFAASGNLYSWPFICKTTFIRMRYVLFESLRNKIVDLPLGILVPLFLVSLERFFDSKGNAVILSRGVLILF